MKQTTGQDMTEATIVITGASSGIGAAAARRLARTGATVVPVGGSADATAVIAAELGVEPLFADYTRLGEVRALADLLLAQYPRIDVLAHNAGTMFGERGLTEDGHERTLQVNYLAPFLLQSLLHERLSASGGHVVVTSSLAHYNGRIRLDDLDYSKRTFTTAAAYADSKLADLLFAREIARRTTETGITAVAHHPGVVRSNVGHQASGMLGLAYNTAIGRATMIDTERGADSLVHLATHADPRHINGQYFHRLRPNFPTSRQARDADLAHQLWTTTEDMLSREGSTAQPWRS